MKLCNEKDMTAIVKSAKAEVMDAYVLAVFHNDHLSIEEIFFNPGVLNFDAGVNLMNFEHCQSLYHQNSITRN